MSTSAPAPGDVMRGVSFGIGGVHLMGSLTVERVTPSGMVISSHGHRLKHRGDGKYTEKVGSWSAWFPDDHRVVTLARRQQVHREAEREARSAAEHWKADKSDLGRIDALVAALGALRALVVEQDDV